MTTLTICQSARSRVALGGLLVIFGLSCASTSSDSFESPPEVAPPVVDEPASDEQGPGSESDGTEKEDLSVVIEEGQPIEEPATKSLVVAARRERERRLHAPQPEIVITDENLAEYATGELTLVVESADSAAEGETESMGEDDAGATADDEIYWRDRIRQARLDWMTSLQEIEHLEGRVAELRRRFYEEDDPFYRDTQIKPSWDQSLDRLEEARDVAEEHRTRVEEILEEGRRAGALPGWLREGIELEPDVRDDAPADLPEHDIQEPETVEPREPGGGR